MYLRLILLAGFLFSFPIAIAHSEDKKGTDDKEDAKLDPTEYLPGPAGIPIKVPRLMERQLKKHRVAQSRTLGGNSETWFVIGLLETTHSPRETSVGDVGRALAVFVDLLMLPVTIPAGEPGLLTNNMGPPPPDWVRSDIASVHKVKGKEEALELVYAFTTERVLDPPDPQVLHRQRQWFMLSRTKKEDEAAKVEKAALKSIGEKIPTPKRDAKLVKGVKDLPDLDKVFDDPEVKMRRKSIEELLEDVDDFKPEELAAKLRKMNEELNAIFENGK